MEERMSEERVTSEMIIISAVVRYERRRRRRRRRRKVFFLASVPRENKLYLNRSFSPTSTRCSSKYCRKIGQRSNNNFTYSSIAVSLDISPNAIHACLERQGHCKSARVSSSLTCDYFLSRRGIPRLECAMHSICPV